MAHKKAGGSTKNSDDSASKRLGLKKFGGETVQPGDIIVRQRGTQYHPGAYVGCGTDYTLYAKIAGKVIFAIKGKNRRRTVSIEPLVTEVAVAA